jgi:hypothetical protein
MRCECCNRQLDDVEATARFAESGNFVGMCTKCRKFLPKNIPVILRTDLLRKEKDDDDEEQLNDFNFEEDVDDEENWN